MNLFGKQPQEQAMQTLIHDTSNALTSLNFHLENALAEMDAQSEAQQAAGTESYVGMTEVMRAQKDYERVKKAIDAYFVQFKNDFPAVS